MSPPYSIGLGRKATMCPRGNPRLPHAARLAATAVAVALVAFAGGARAAGPPADPVEALREELRFNPVFGPPEAEPQVQRKVLEKFKERLGKRARAVVAPGDLRRALFLTEWRGLVREEGPGKARRPNPFDHEEGVAR